MTRFSGSPPRPPPARPPPRPPPRVPPPPPPPAGLARRGQHVGGPLGRRGRRLRLSLIPVDLDQVLQVGHHTRLVALRLAEPQGGGGRLERRGRVAHLEAALAEHAVGERAEPVRVRPVDAV